MIAYMLRGLTIGRKDAVIAGRGSAKLSWVCTLAGLSERGGRYARKELIRLGWIERDTGSHQWKLNRDGAYFSINLDWSPEVAKGSKCCGEEGACIAPRQPGKCPVIAPPIKDRKTPYGSKNQKTSRSGVSTKQSEGEIVDTPPNLRNVQTQDLFHLSRCEALYWQAVAAGDLIHSESAALNFLASAVRARSVKTEAPAKVFIAILRRRLWHHITCDQEEVARRALTRAREHNPSSFRIPLLLRSTAIERAA
jgi:hypothetical protein